MLFLRKNFGGFLDSNTEEERFQNQRHWAKYWTNIFHLKCFAFQYLFLFLIFLG